MTEDQLEQEALGWLADVGYQHRYGPELAPDGSTPERSDYRQVLLLDRLRRAVATLNPTVPTAAREDVIAGVPTPVIAGGRMPCIAGVPTPVIAGLTRNPWIPGRALDDTGDVRPGMTPGTSGPG